MKLNFNDIFPNVFVLCRHDDFERKKIFTENFKNTGIKYQFWDFGANAVVNGLIDIIKLMDNEELTRILTSKVENDKSPYSIFNWGGQLKKSFEDVDFFKEIILRLGAVGTTIAHLELIKYAKHNNLKNIFVFENDTIPLKDFQNKIQKYLQTIPSNWDFLSFGNYMYTWFNERENRVTRWVNEDCDRLETWFEYTDCLTLPGYAMNNTLFDIILSLFDKYLWVIDAMYNDLFKGKIHNFQHRPINAYICRDNIFIPNPYLPTDTTNHINLNYGYNQQSDISAYENCINSVILNNHRNNNHRKPRIFNINLFYREFDLLELKLNELYDYVDYFVIVESKKTHSGEQKELLFETQKERFQKYSEKIIHLVCDFEGDLFEERKSVYNVSHHWLCEHFQRDYALICNEIEFLEDDILIMTDMDEIPNKNSIPIIEQKLLKDDYDMVKLDLDMSYYYLNTQFDFRWDAFTYATTYSKLKQNNFYATGFRNYVLNKLKTYTLREFTGWHFSFLDTPENMLNKIKSFAHCDDIGISERDINDIKKGITDLKSFWNENEICGTVVGIDKLPETVQNNLSFWKKYLYEKG